VAQQAAEVSDLPGGDPRLRQEVGAQQLGEDPGVDLVVLQASMGDRLAGRGMHQVRLQLALLQQVSQPSPPVGRLEGDPRAGLQLVENSSQVLGAVLVVVVRELGSCLVQHGDLAPLAVHIDSDVNHLWASLSRARLEASRSLGSLSSESEARPHILRSSISR
jgi:hypothetical protein